MKITVFGAGYVGLVISTCFADLGNTVLGYDIDKEKIENLQKGILPIYEPGLKELVERNIRENRLSFTSDEKKAVRDSDIIFLCVGTPPRADGSAELKYIFSTAETIGKHTNGYKLVIDKSTVPVNTARQIKEKILQNQAQKTDVDVVSNPEFLREGQAIRDFMNPDRVIIGVDSEKAKQLMMQLYRPIERTGKPIYFTTIQSAELIKHASNAMLATRISFMNELSHLCEKVGADIKEVAKGMGLDNRIGPRFLQAGAGYGGSCFPKDLQSLAATMKEHGIQSKILDAVHEVNESQKHSIIQKLKTLVPDLKDKKIAIWGLAFKPKTDDIREAPSIVLISHLLNEGAKITAFDPVASENIKSHFNNHTSLEFRNTPYEAIKDCHALVIMTEWDEFRALDLQAIKTILAEPNILDARNLYEPSEIRALGFNYKGIGR